MKMTKELFKREIEEIKDNGKVFTVESEDSGSVYFIMHGCSIAVNLEEGIEGEITIFKPNVEMEVTLDFDIINSIIKENDEYLIEFSNGMADVVIRTLEKTN